jgi:hypothetical protein
LAALEKKSSRFWVRVSYSYWCVSVCSSSLQPKGKAERKSGTKKKKQQMDMNTKKAKGRRGTKHLVVNQSAIREGNRNATAESGPTRGLLHSS